MERNYVRSREEARRIIEKRRRKTRMITLLVMIVLVLVTVVTVACLSAANKENRAQKMTRKEKKEIESAQQKEEESSEQSKEVQPADRKRETGPQITPEVRITQLVSDADKLAASYDYDGAIALIQSFGTDYASHQELADAISRYESTKATMVRFPDVTQVTHVFFHSLIADNARAFDGDYDSDGYNLYMTTIYEFEHMLEEMYKRGFVLVNVQDIAKTDPATGKFVAGDIMLPDGKKPMVMSQDDVNYYEYMTDSDDDHFPDQGGDGFATKIVIGEDGYPTCEYITADGQTVTGDYDLVPILEKFCQKHPDFSYRGARATLGVTGYQGVFGYRTHPDWKEILGEAKWNQEIEEAKKVAQCLKDHGWVIASHSFGHPHYGNMDVESLRTDVQKWEDQVQPIVGNAEVFIYPYGNDIAGIEAYSGSKYEIMYEAGYRYFCNVDSHEYWVQIHDDYIRQGRRNLDGYRLYWNPEMLDDLFDVNDVMDPERPLPVPAL